MEKINAQNIACVTRLNKLETRMILGRWKISKFDILRIHHKVQVRMVETFESFK